MNRRTISTWILSASLGSLTMGCPSDDDTEPTADTEAATEDAATDDAADASTGAAEDGGQEGSTGEDVHAVYDCVDAEFTITGPLAGPGLDPEQGLLEPLQDTYIASSTQLYVNPDPQSQAEFFELVASINAQLAEAEGLVAVSFALEPNCNFNRTLSVWRSIEDMNRFMSTGAHAVAMSRTLDISSTGKVTHWEVSADAIPTWDDAVAHMNAIDHSAIYD